jgi:hypothetical protein
MKRLVARSMTLAVLTVLSLASIGTAAFAVGPTSVTRTGGLHFVGTPDVTATKTADTAFLTATGEVAGAGPTATATLSATADVTRGCINRGSQGQQPSGLQRSFQTTTGSQTFNTRSGRGSFNVPTDPVTAAPFPCPDKMTPVLVSVTFTDVVLTVTSQTGTTTATFPDIDP